ncbi:MAG: endonuclease MutS2 [Bacteroidetes bacterium]|nr:endonuclease MutS2 [Bacteroidota bacterium]MBU1372741.1 endonuclease MutS2 [Bacteroidota bacterium]MBU1484937.1 endonuclease MutS2 [Bacteroidota bacterium]MBU1762253.1 endonuclease MutS2 [Bacteroidota bacterium]MBU2374910.1 endonuclease MutS2 [Bacteroidota bacterium]
MLYPNNSYQKLGFDDIKDLIKSFCISEMGQGMVDKIQFMSSYDQINKFLRQTSEFKNILENDQPLPIQSFFDIKRLAEKARIEGTFLSEDEVFQIYSSLQTVFAVIRYFEDRSGLYPNLEALFEHLPIEKNILKHIEAVLDVKGKIKPNASRLLADITSAIAKAEQEARKKIDQIFKNAQQNNWVADGSLTVREGRICIPILAENKRKLKGFVHDESASGQTVFIEPEEVFSLNNKIRDLEFEKRREIIRILTELTNQLRPYVPILLSYHGFLTKLDFVRAKALFAQKIGAEMPILLKDASLKLINAKHPLLLLNHKENGKEVVPLNVHLDDQVRILLVSGPNAGGKSVAMKTVGLLQIMVQAGLLIPATAESEVGIFKQLFADIGDDQSIESDLSTYSAHLSKMRYFTEHTNSKTLVLIDEFGTGTDPLFGGPIAEAVLEELNRKKSFGVITTHYSNLKLFANDTAGLENGSMIFDNEHLQPLYRLEMGKPGSSYAFEIAQKIGLSKHLIDLAKSKISVQQRKVDTLLVDLEREKKEVYESKVEFEKQKRKYQSLLAENEQLKTYYDENKRNLIREAKQEAQQIIKSANKLVENTIAEIKESKADKIKTQDLRANLQTELKKNEVKPLVAPKTKANEEIIVGDWVKMLDSENLAQVLEVAKDNLIVAFGELRSVVKKKRVEKVSNKNVPKAVKTFGTSTFNDSAASFSPEIDLRGKRGEEALAELERYFDRAVMFGFSNFKIIHGKGDGILRKLIRNYLKGYSQVNKMEDEHVDRGGDGITYVYLQ